MFIGGTFRKKPKLVFFVFLTAIGKITVTLQHECWGAVKISTRDDTGYVSGRHWSDTLSKELCKELGCGTEILRPTRRPDTRLEIKFKSLFKMKNSVNMSQYSIVKMETNPESTRSPEPRDPAYVVCKGTGLFFC